MQKSEQESQFWVSSKIDMVNSLVALVFNFFFDHYAPRELAHQTLTLVHATGDVLMNYNLAAQLLFRFQFTWPTRPQPVDRISTSSSSTSFAPKKESIRLNLWKNLRSQRSWMSTLTRWVISDLSWFLVFSWPKCFPTPVTSWQRLGALSAPVFE